VVAEWSEDELEALRTWDPEADRAFEAVGEVVDMVDPQHAKNAEDPVRVLACAAEGRKPEARTGLAPLIVRDASMVESDVLALVDEMGKGDEKAWNTFRKWGAVEVAKKLAVGIPKLGIPKDWKEAATMATLFRFLAGTGDGSGPKGPGGRGGLLNLNLHTGGGSVRIDAGEEEGG
jgi:hypothetical protein